MPYVCLRIPTGGGKTLVACHSIAIASKELAHSDHTVVLWLTPSNVIHDQTLKALKDRKHPYRQAVEAENSAVNILDISEALSVQPAMLNNGLTIIVSTMQAFRVDNTEGRKLHDDSGTLMSHFSSLPGEVLASLECYPNGVPLRSLANVLRVHRRWSLLTKRITLAHPYLLRH